MSRSFQLLLVGLLVMPGLAWGERRIGQRSKNRQSAASSEAVDRTRETVKMLDDIYKTAVVLITTHYVKDEDDLAAGSAAKALFAPIEKTGWHKVALLDGSGEPYNDENVARDAFDKAAVKQIKGGEAFVEKVVYQGGKPYLRVATSVPVVLQKCTMCHENYKQAKKGEAVGLLSYTVPVR